MTQAQLLFGMGISQTLIQELPSLDHLEVDAEVRHRLFPSTREGIFLAHAGVAPVSGPAANILKSKAEQWSKGFSQQDYDHESRLAREVAARFFEVYPDEVALLGPTSLGLSLVALGLPWKAGDEVVIHSRDYPANVYIWRSLANRGVIVREITPEEPGQITTENLRPLLTSGRVRLVALSSAHFLSGSILDCEAIGQLVHEYGSLFCLDGIQTLGAVRTDLRHVDFVAADSHKWMLGPVGAGVLIVKRHAQDILRPALLGAENVVTCRFISAEKIEYVAGAARYEPGVLNLPGIVPMRASLEMLSAWGIDAIERRVTALKKYIFDLLESAGAEFLGKNHTKTPGGILTFRFSQLSSRRLHAALLSEGITTSLRWTADGVEWIRVSPHVSNTKSDCETLVGVIKEQLDKISC